ncbi:MAG: Uma2 family endonuclease [Abitibacteriaceae bacterium]|nr:Uma2 family endonuclease [Abditibacteriaceae bacterium]
MPTIESSIIEDDLWRCTKDQYYQMDEMGWFNNTRVELLEGIIYEKHPDTPSGEPRPLPWDINHYYHMWELGWFDGLRVELIEGAIIPMTPMLSLHATAVTQIGDILRQAFGAGYFVRTQLPLRLSSRSEPEPDIAIIAGLTSDFRNAHPTSAALIVEVSDTTLRFDRRHKASLYARSNIRDYWIANLNANQLEIYRQPIEAQEEPYGYKYEDVTILRSGDTISPLAAPQATVAVADLLP